MGPETPMDPPAERHVVVGVRAAEVEHIGCRTEMPLVSVRGPDQRGDDWPTVDLHTSDLVPIRTGDACGHLERGIVAKKLIDGVLEVDTAGSEQCELFRIP